MALRKEGNYLRKRPVTLSLTNEAKRLLWELSTVKGNNYSAIVETLIREEAYRLKIEVKRIEAPYYQEKER